MSFNLTDDELRKMFDCQDKDKSGYLELNEVKEIVTAANPCATEEFFKTYMFHFDGKGDGRITIDEFLKGIQKLRDWTNGMKEMFNRCDKDSSGCLDYAELRQALAGCNPPVTDELFDKICCAVDPDKSGKVTFEEFAKFLDK